MPDSNPPGDEPEIRPEVVQAVFSALVDADPAKLALLEETGLTAAERRQAEQLFLASMPSLLDHKERQVEVYKVLIGGGKLTKDTSWSDLFDGLTPERAAQLRDLYDALPDGGRAEYDRRYGHPEDT